MKLDRNKSLYDQAFGWVAHPDGAHTDKERQLAERRYDMEILGGVIDETASYEYDEWALVKLDGDFYLFSSAGCSCPAPSETWALEIGPATIAEIRARIVSGDYAGYTLPKREEAAFMALLDEAEAK